MSLPISFVYEGTEKATDVFRSSSKQCMVWGKLAFVGSIQGKCYITESWSLCPGQLWMPQLLRSILACITMLTNSKAKKKNWRLQFNTESSVVFFRITLELSPTPSVLTSFLWPRSTRVATTFPPMVKQSCLKYYGRTTISLHEILI